MLNLRSAARVVVVGGGTAGWFAALTLRRMFAPQVEVRLVESPAIGIIGVGEGGLLNLVDGLRRNGIDLQAFMRETGAAFKLGFAYEGWRTGAQDDRYYHLFGRQGVEVTNWVERDFHPLLSAMVRDGVPLHRYIPGFSAIEGKASQREAAEMLKQGEASGLSTSFHFDSHRMADFLCRVAVARGVVHQQGRVDEIVVDAQGMATGVRIDGAEPLDVDFLVDATGLARLAVGKKLGMKWRSFSDYLLMDRAVPFHMPHPQPNPALVTRAIAMPAGWMWQIPLVERVGAGYVFSSAHTDENSVIDEIHRRIGPDVKPMKMLRFEPGHYEKVWVGNIMALGLASGFVEPLEATSIGQMLEQLRNFEVTLKSCDGVVPQPLIDDFNEANAKCWSGIRDFLRMHYDCPRRDTPFWRDVAASPMPPSYAELKQCFQHRTPRLADVKNYAINGWQGIFHVINWLFVAAPLGVVPPEAAVAELAALPPASRDRVQVYMQQLQRNLAPAATDVRTEGSTT